MATNVLLSRGRLLQGTAAVAISLAMPALLPPEPAMAAAQLGAPAPGFTLTSANGHAVSLADFRQDRRAGMDQSRLPVCA